MAAIVENLIHEFRRWGLGLGSNSDGLLLLVVRQSENLIREIRVLQGVECPCPYHPCQLVVFGEREVSICVRIENWEAGFV